MKDTVVGILAWAGILGVPIIIGTSCGRVDEANKKNVENEFAEFCKANDATPAFQGLPSGELLTIDLQRSLLANQKRVAFKAPLSDLYRSEKLGGALVARFYVSQSGSQIGVFLKCTANQLQQLHDDYQKDKNASFMIVGEFEQVEPFALVDGTGVKTPLSANENDYAVIGKLVTCRKSAFRKSSDQESD